MILRLFDQQTTIFCGLIKMGDTVRVRYAFQQLF